MNIFIKTSNSPRTRAQFSENQSTPKLENRKTSPCSPRAPNFLQVLPSRMVGWNELCNHVCGFICQLCKIGQYSSLSIIIAIRGMATQKTIEKFRLHVKRFFPIVYSKVRSDSSVSQNVLGTDPV